MSTKKITVHLELPDSADEGDVAVSLRMIADVFELGVISGKDWSVDGFWVGSPDT